MPPRPLPPPTLIAFAGLPGVGKTTIARAFSARIAASYLRADTIETAMLSDQISIDQIQGSGYQVAAEVARDNLKNGLHVVIDCVNPWLLTREMFRAIATETATQILEIEVVCSDLELHRHRLEERESLAPSHLKLDWHAVKTRDYHGWDREPFRIDTATIEPDQAVDLLLEKFFDPSP